MGIVGVTLIQPLGLAGPANPRAVEASELSALQALFPQQIVISEHTFWVDLPKCGTCIFVPIRDLQGRPALSLHLVDDDRVIYSLPQSEHDRNWAAWDVLAVAFTDLDSDGKDDIMVLSEYMTGIGPQGAVPFPAMSIYYMRKQGFELDAAIGQSLTEEGVETIGEALEFLGN